MNKNNLSAEDIQQIKYIAAQGNYKINRVRLICNLWRIEKSDLLKLIAN